MLPDDLRTAVLTIRDDPTCAAEAGFPYAGATMLCARTPLRPEHVLRRLRRAAAGRRRGRRPAARRRHQLGPRVRLADLAERVRRRARSCARGSTRRRRRAPIRTGSVYISGRPLVGRAIHCVPQVTRRDRHRRPLAARRRPDRDAARATGCAGPTPVRRWRAPSRRATAAAPSRRLAAGRDRRRPRAPTTARPTLRRPDIRCTSGSATPCSARSARRATDRNGIAAVAFLVAADDRPLRWVHGASENGELWQAHLPTAARYEVVARAVDEAGNITRASRTANTRWADRRQARPVAHGREEDDLADRGRARQQHHHAVDADAEAAGRRHAVAERVHVVVVDRVRLGVAGAAHLRLLLEPRVLLVGVVQLGVAVARSPCRRQNASKRSVSDGSPGICRDSGDSSTG